MDGLVWEGGGEVAEEGVEGEGGKMVVVGVGIGGIGDWIVGMLYGRGFVMKGIDRGGVGRKGEMDGGGRRRRRGGKMSC